MKAITISGIPFLIAAVCTLFVDNDEAGAS